MKSSLRILHVIAIGAALSCASRAIADSININFGPIISGSAGYPAPGGQSIWNSLSGASGTSGTINDSGNSPTSAAVTYDSLATGSWSPTPSGTNNATLLGNYLNGVPGYNGNLLSPPNPAYGDKVVVSGIPSSINAANGYDVVVYVAGATDATSNATLSEYTLNGTDTRSVQTGKVSTLSLADANNQGSYIIFENVHGGGFTLTTNQDDLDPNNNHYVNSPIDGISIIGLGSSDGGGGGGSTPEPGSVVLMALGAFGLLIAARRRRTARP